MNDAAVPQHRRAARVRAKDRKTKKKTADAEVQIVEKAKKRVRFDIKGDLAKTEQIKKILSAKGMTPEAIETAVHCYLHMLTCRGAA